MKILANGLQQHLDSGVTTLCQCWKLVPHYGAALGFTDHDRTLSFDGVAFEADSGFSASTLESGAGFAPRNMDVSGVLRSDRLNEADLSAGVYDHAEIEIWLVNWQAVSQRLLQCKGHLGRISHGDTGFEAEMRGLADLLDQPQGRVFAHVCDATLGDGRCRVALAPRMRGLTVTAVRENRYLTVSGGNDLPRDWLSRGEVIFTGGANATRRMEIRRHQIAQGQVVLDLWQPMPMVVVPGDHLTATPGCDGMFSTCRSKFGNAVNFRGFPHMPGNDAVTAYVNRDDANNGATRR